MKITGLENKPAFAPARCAGIFARGRNGRLHDFQPLEKTGRLISRDWKSRFLAGCFPGYAARSVLVFLIGAALSVTFCRPASAQDGVRSEYAMKAAFIFNFAKYVEWPPDAFADSSTPVTIGILGDDPFGPAMEKTIGDRKINGRQVVIRRFRSAGEIRGPHACHVLFVANSEKGRLDKILSASGQAGILTIGETEEFLNKGGMIRFVNIEGKLKFEVNGDAAEKESVKISSHVLSLAVSVKNRNGGGK